MTKTNMSLVAYFMQNDKIRGILLIITQVVWLFSVCNMIYSIVYQYIIKTRENKWRNAPVQHVLNAFVNILHETNYFEWHKLYLYQIIVTHNITYTDIIRSYNNLSLNDRIIFWKRCTNDGLHPTFTKIMSKHLPQ